MPTMSETRSIWETTLPTLPGDRSEAMESHGDMQDQIGAESRDDNVSIKDSTRHTTAETTETSTQPVQSRKPGRPAKYLFHRPDEELGEEERKLKNAVLKRRQRQNRSYQRRKVLKLAHKDTVGDLDKSLGNGTSSELYDNYQLDRGTSQEAAAQDDLVGDIVRAESQDQTNEEIQEADIEECVLMAVKGTMDRSTAMTQSASVKNIVFGSLRDRFTELSSETQTSLKALSVFPRDFDLMSASAVMGKDVGGNMNGAMDTLQTLFGSGFLTSNNDRFELNQVAKLFLSENPGPAQSQHGWGAEDPSELSVGRYINYFQGLLTKLTDPTIHKLGFAREHAMQVFDIERQNMDYSLELCRLNGPERLREFLAAGAAVMRYCVDASTRIQYLQTALTEPDGNGRLDLGGSSSLSRLADGIPGDRRNVVRLELARAEALCDNQALDEAEEPLQKALELMDRDFTKTSNGILDTVLVLLLSASVKINLSKADQGYKLLVEALKILNKIGLGKTTLAVNALTNLVTIYVQRNQIEKANYVATELLNTLHAMRYDKMPIYADALGVLAMVRMASADYEDAAKQFGTALEIVAGWGSKQWTSVPVQHCLDLDIWLMEGLAICLNLQGSKKDAEYMLKLATDARSHRRLRPISYEILAGESVVPLWLTTSRHLY